MSIFSAQEFFTAAFNADSTRTIAFKPEWNNGTGYFNDLVHEALPELKVGELGRVYTGDQNDRRIIVVKTRFGNAVVFDRYTGNAQKEDDAVFVMNIPEEVKKLARVAETRIDADSMSYLVGEPKYTSICPNIGETIEKFAKYFDEGYKSRRQRFIEREATA